MSNINQENYSVLSVWAVTDLFWTKKLIGVGYMKSTKERIGQLGQQIYDSAREISLRNDQVDKLIEDQGSFVQIHALLSDIARRKIFHRGLKLKLKQLELYNVPRDKTDKKKSALIFNLRQ